MYLYEIALVFENCDATTIPGKYLFGFYCGPVKDTYCNTNFYDNFVFHHQSVEDFSIGIFKEAEKVAKTAYEDMPDKIETLSKRDDLCAVEITYWDGTDISSIKKSYCYLPWNGDDFHNSAIKVEKNDRGDVFISVGNAKPCDSIFFTSMEEMAKNRGLI